MLRSRLHTFQRRDADVPVFLQHERNLPVTFLKVSSSAYPSLKFASD